jgi:hypothetical protein
MSDRQNLAFVSCNNEDYNINQSDHDENLIISEDSQSEVNSNNVTLTNVSMIETIDKGNNNNRSYDEYCQSSCVFNYVKFKNVTVRANENLDTKVSTTGNESFEKKRGLSVNLEFQNKLNSKLKRSIVDDEESSSSNSSSINRDSDRLDQEENYTNRCSSLYLQDKYHNFKLDEEFLSVSAANEEHLAYDLRLKKLDTPPKINQFYVDELESERSLNSLKYDGIFNANDTSNNGDSSKSASTSSMSYRSDSSYTNEENSMFKSSIYNPQPIRKIPILNQNAACFKPLSNKNLNLTNTSTPTGKLTSKLNPAYQETSMHEYSLYNASFQRQTKMKQISNENFHDCPRPSANSTKFTNEYYTRNQINFLSKSHTGMPGTSRVPKSSTTHFSEYRRENGDYDFPQCYQSSFPITFGHSTSFDNIGALNSMSSELNRSNKFINVTYRYNDNNNNNNISFNNPIEKKQDSDPIVLHVRNLDYKISPDEWQRILLENFRKICKEVFFLILKYKKRCLYKLFFQIKF